MNIAVDTKAFVSAWKDEEDLAVLTFTLNGEVFAIPATLVREIMDVVAETVVPGARSFVGSVINFRGRVIPLTDIRLAFGMEATPTTIDSRIVVIELEIDGESTLLGVRTDRVHEVTRLQRSRGEPPPSVGMRWRSDFIECLVKREGEFIIVPNLFAIFGFGRQHRLPNQSQAAG
jgi:purine-binding chemotaxis protein CheW